MRKVLTQNWNPWGRIPSPIPNEMHSLCNQRRFGVDILATTPFLCNVRYISPGRDILLPLFTVLCQKTETQLRDKTQLTIHTLGIYSFHHCESISHKAGLKWGTQMHAPGLRAKLAQSQQPMSHRHLYSTAFLLWRSYCSSFAIPRTNILHLSVVFCPNTEAQLRDIMQFIGPKLDTTLGVYSSPTKTGYDLYECRQ